MLTLHCYTADGPACTNEHGWAESHRIGFYNGLYTGLIPCMARGAALGGSLALLVVYLRLMSEGGCQPPGAAVNKKWMEGEVGGALSCCSSSLTLTSLVGALQLPPGNAVYTILNPTVAPGAARFYVTLCHSCWSFRQTLCMEILISETTEVYSWGFSVGWCFQSGGGLLC